MGKIIFVLFFNAFSNISGTNLNPSSSNNELPIFFWDESYTSLEAEEITQNIFKNLKEQRKKLDKFAAKIILDDFFRENINL